MRGATRKQMDKNSSLLSANWDPSPFLPLTQNIDIWDSTCRLKTRIVSSNYVKKPIKKGILKIGVGFPKQMVQPDYLIEKSTTVNTSSLWTQSIQLTTFSFPPLKYQQTLKGKAFKRKK